MRGHVALSPEGAFAFFLLIIPISSTTIVNRSLALIFTSTKSTTRVPTFQKLFGDPAVYVDRWASGLRTDLGLSLEGLDSSSTDHLFGTLTYDYDRQLVFFSDNRMQSLNYGAYVYNNNTNFYAFNPTQVSGQVSGMSVDWVSYSLYWVDGHYKRICVVSLNLILMWRPIVDVNLTSPQDVAVNPGTGHLFWSDAGPEPRIERSTLDGLERTVLVPSSRLTSPATLTVDVEGQRLFWLDVGSSAIGSVAFDGSNVNVWTRSGLTTGVMAMYKNFLFVGDKRRPELTVHRVTDTGLSHATNLSVEGLNGFIDMTFYSKSNQPTVNSLCAHQNGGCSHFCFTVPPFSRRCQCSVGFVPSPNNINCTTQPFVDDFVVVADTMQRNVFQVRPRTGELRALLPHSDRFPTAVDFDFLHRYIYWVDNKTNAIGKVSLDGRVNEYIFQYTSPVATISGIAVDPVREMLYYTDSGLGRIVQMTTLGTSALIIYSQATATPKAIAIDVKTRRLFWSDCASQSSASIRRADIADEGLENILTIVRAVAGCPSIAIDTDVQKIFWSEDRTGKVWTSSDDGSGRTLIYTAAQTLPGAEVNIAVGKEYVFISNTKTQWLTKVNRRNLSVSQQSPQNVFHTPRGIVTSDASYTFPEPFRDNFLIVVDTFEQRRNLFQIDIETGSMIPLLVDRPPNPVAVAFDAQERDVFWTDSSGGFVAKYSLVDARRSRGNSTNVIHRQPNAGSALDGIALDSVNRKLYVSDAGLEPKILEMDLDGSALVTVASDAGMKPRALVVNAENRRLYCTDWGDEPGIFRINLRTKTRNRIIADNMVWPNALAIDFSEDVMYWADAHIDRIEMAKLDGSERTTLVTESNAHYFGITLSPRYIYFTDWQHGAVRRLDRRTLQLSEQKPKIFKRLSGIVYYGSTTYNASRVNSTISSSVFSTSASSVAKTTPPASTAPPFLPPKDDKQFQGIPEKGHASIDHTMVIIIAVVVGGVVLIAAMVTVGVCVVAKRRRSIDSSSQPAEHRYVVPESNRCHATLTSSRSSNTYDYIPPNLMDSAGYLNPMANSSPDEDYLKPVGVYYSIKDDSDKTDLFYKQGSFKPFD